MSELQVSSLGWQGPLEEGTATHPSVLAWSIPWTEEPGGRLKWLSGHAQLTYIIVSVQVYSKLISFIYSCMCVCVCVCILFFFSWALSQVTLEVKNLPANAGDVRDTGLIPGLGRSPAEGMATHSSFLAWRIPWTEESGVLQSMGLQRVEHSWSDLALAFFFFLILFHYRPLQDTECSKSLYVMKSIFKICFWLTLSL